MEREQQFTYHSPRQQVELGLELNQLNEHHQFEEQNPFSYYQEDHQRERHSSDDENNQHPKTNENSNGPLKTNGEEKNKEQQQFEKIEIDKNLSSKPPIPLLQSPKPKKKLEESSKDSNADLFNNISIPPLAFNSPSPPQKNTQQLISNSPLLGSFKEEQFNLEGLNNHKEPQHKARPIPATDRVYRSELQLDMEQLKRKFMGKDPKKKPDSKKEEKQAINKTIASMHKKHKEPTFEFQEMRMLIKMGFQKKKTNYEMLKEWDKKRAESLALHGKIIEELQNQVDIRIKSSLENFQNYQTFFREKAKQQEKYSSSPVINTRYALQNNSLSKNVYINCSVILNSLCDENTARCKKINDFIQLIRNNILKQLTENHLTSSQRELLKVREKISTLKSALKKQNTETEERANELALLFNEQSLNITNNTDKDFYRAQLSFLRKAMQQIEVQRKLGEYCLEYYHTAVQEELKRSQVIRQAMLTYSKGLKATYYLQPGLQCPEIQQMSKQQEIKLIEQFFSLDEIFDQRTIELFKQKNNLQHSQDLTIEAFTQYISNLDFNHFDSRILLLKEFSVRHIVGKGKELKEEPCYLVITVDNFLHLFLNHTKQNSNKPDITIKISSKWLQLRADKDQIVHIVKKEQRRNSMMSYFWDSRVEKVYKLKFAKRDNKEEFIDYISKLMVDQF